MGFAYLESFMKRECPLMRSIRMRVIQSKLNSVTKSTPTNSKGSSCLIAMTKALHTIGA